MLFSVVIQVQALEHNGLGVNSGSVIYQPYIYIWTDDLTVSDSSTVKMVVKIIFIS